MKTETDNKKYLVIKHNGKIKRIKDKGKKRIVYPAIGSEIEEKSSLKKEETDKMEIKAKMKSGKKK